MAESKKVGTIPCPVCGKRYEYLTAAHTETHPPGRPQTDPGYLEWVAEKRVVPEGDVPLDPSGWRENRDLFPGWRDGTVDPG